MANESSNNSLPVVGSVLQSLPLKDVFAAPLVAVIEAHNTACNALETFIQKVGHNDKGELKSVEFKYSENEPGGQVNRTINVPLIAVLPLPSFGIDRLSVDFDVKIDASEANSDADAKDIGGEAGVGWGPVSVKLKGSVSHKSEQTRKTDTSARYTVHMEASRQPMPEAFNRVIDTLLSTMRPTTGVSGAGTIGAPKSAAPAVIPAANQTATSAAPEAAK
jgi:hypothetical protein